MIQFFESYKKSTFECPLGIPVIKHPDGFFRKLLAGEGTNLSNDTSTIPHVLLDNCLLYLPK